MAISRNEIKRKVFHHLTLIYMALYAFSPRWLALGLLGISLLIVGALEFLRLRRPEINAWFLARFEGIHRESEIMHVSGIFWTLLGSWLTMLVFDNRRIVLPALGFLAFGDAAAALGGQKWGRHPWPKNAKKTIEGSLSFLVVSIAWAKLFLRWPVAVIGAVVGALVESRVWPWNDNLWIPLLSGAALSVLNLVLGKHR
jgi:dolichol kinase